jgi:hypothetical protein
MVFAGYMVAVVPLVSLTDRVSARMIYLGASCLNVVSSFGSTEERKPSSEVSEFQAI